MVPLLPFEKDLIEILGWTEEEYQYFSTRAAWKGRRRPDGYEHIPDIHNDPVTAAVIAIVVGVVSTAASLLMRPDIPEPETPEQKKGSTQRLGDLMGRDRFGTTSGFNSQADLAEYASVIPVIFCRRDDDIGGILAAPQLVWSRALSYGREEAWKGLMVVGEAGMADGIARPDLAGIYLGTTPLDATVAQKFAFYWNRNSRVNGRMAARNYAYGTRGAAFAGDTQNNDEIYLLPTSQGLQPWFSGAWSPNSNNKFGCYAPMANGTGYRVNYQLMPLPEPQGDDDGEANEDQDRNWAVKLGRGKVSGFYGYLADGDRDNAEFNKFMRWTGQKGTGREYNRFMGITVFNGQSFEGGPDDHKRRVEASVGDIITYTIAGGVLEETFYNRNGQIPAPVDDINNATIGFREAADDALHLGTKVMIGKTLWVVVERTQDIWGKDQIGPFETRPNQEITLQCIETFGPPQGIGYVSRKMVYTLPFRTDDQGFSSYQYGNPDRAGLTAGPGFYPLMLAELATVRNTRPCIATEIGLRSQVWNRASGLCNFAALPTPLVIRDTEREGDSLQSGTMNTYFTRTSVFTIQVRKAGSDPGGEPYEWANMNEQFCVQGDEPVDQFNFIRINHPEEEEYEYRFVPKNGGDVTQHMTDTQDLWLLDARIKKTSMPDARIQGSYSTPYGTFTIQAVGRIVYKTQIEFCPEMATDTEVKKVVVYVDAPQTVVVDEYWPDLESGFSRPTAVRQVNLLPLTASATRSAALCWELFGQASSFGLSRTKTIRHYPLTDNRALTIKYTGVVNAYFPTTSPYFPGQRSWAITNVELVGSEGSWNVAEQQNCPIPATPGNPRNPLGFANVGIRAEITATDSAPSQGGRQSGLHWEFFGSPDDVSLGTTKSTTIEVASAAGDTSIISCTSSTIAVGSAYTERWGLNSAWGPVTYVGVPGTTSGDWDVGEQCLYTTSMSNSNPFKEAIPGGRVGVRLQVSAVVKEREVPGMRSERVFEQAAQLCELSNYSERTTSAQSNPEHSIEYVNEFVTQSPPPQYDRLTLSGVALRASKTFQTIDQLRVWLATGIPCKRFHPSELGTVGPSSLFPDLIYFLLTDERSGIGKIFAEELIDTDSFTRSCQFLKTNKLFYNGALADKVNLRSYTAETAPQLLLNLVIANGKFGLEPAIPVTSAGGISTAPVPIKGIFTGGNIIEGTYELQYLPAEVRRNFTANVRWRREIPNKFPEEETITVRWSEAGSELYPMETLDLTQFCCSQDHAKMVGVFQLATRRFTTHSVTFQTTPYGLDLAPGDYIRVDTIAAPYQNGNNGVVESDGAIISSSALEDAVYPVYYYRRDMADAQEGDMEVLDGHAVDSTFFSSVFSLKYQQQSRGVYQVMELTLEEDGLVTIKATEHPVDSNGASLIGQYLLNQSSFVEAY